MKPLNHKKIEEDEIIERYVMRRLSPEETEAFEEHLFGCGECFEKVKLTEKAISGIREAAKQGLLEEKRHRSLHVFRERSKQLFTQPAIAIAAVVVTLLLLYPAFRGIFLAPRLQRQLEALRTPRVIDYSFSLEESPRRSTDSIISGKSSSEMKITIPRKAEFFTLTFTILESNVPNPAYRAKILTRKNRVIWKTDHLKSLGEFGVYSILCPRSFFKAKTYLLKVEELDNQGNPTGRVHLFPFEIIPA